VAQLLNHMILTNVPNDTIQFAVEGLRPYVKMIEWGRGHPSCSRKDQGGIVNDCLFDLTNTAAKSKSTCKKIRELIFTRATNLSSKAVVIPGRL
jgi:hypothetical protein